MAEIADLSFGLYEQPGADGVAEYLVHSYSKKDGAPPQAKPCTIHDKKSGCDIAVASEGAGSYRSRRRSGGRPRGAEYYR